MRGQETHADPRRSEIVDLARRVRLAVDAVPGMAVPLQAIGSGDAWRSQEARRFHDDHLSPLSQRLYGALGRLEEDVQLVLEDLPAERRPQRPEHQHGAVPGSRDGAHRGAGPGEHTGPPAGPLHLRGEAR